MPKENSFNPADLGNIEPAKVNFIDEPNVQDEHLDESTPAKVEDTPTAPVAPTAQAPETPPVHAETQDSDERYRNLQAHSTKVTQENSELRTRVEQLETRLTTLLSTPQQQIVQPEPATPADSELDKIANEFPELEPIASRMGKLQQQMNSQQTTITQQQESMDKTAQETAQDTQNREILTAHSDAYQINQSVDFQGWLIRQPSYMHNWMRTGSAEQCIDLLTAYKAAAGQQPPPQQNQPDPIDEARKAGAPVNTSAPILNTNDSNKRTWTEAEIKAMPYSEYQILEKELDLAAREGRIIG